MMLPLRILLTPLVICLLSSAAQAQATRTWVSGVGDDANPCSRTAPCKTFAGAISKTAAGGEIDALDPGGFGTVTITKAITIDGGAGQVASVLASGTNGINVNAGVNDVVILRHLTINGISGTGAGGLNGVRYSSGAALHIQDCYIFGFTQDGVNVATTATAALFVNNTFVTNNVNGIHIAPSMTSFVKSMLVQVRAENTLVPDFSPQPPAAAAEPLSTIRPRLETARGSAWAAARFTSAIPRLSAIMLE